MRTEKRERRQESKGPNPVENLIGYSTGDEVKSEEVVYEDDGFATITQHLGPGSVRVQRVPIINPSPRP